MMTLRRLQKDEVLLLFKDFGWDVSNKYYQNEAKRNVYIQFNDGYVVEFRQSKIKSTMYYSDQYSAPEKDVESWIQYNMSHGWKHSRFKEWMEQEKELDETGCCSGAHTRMYLETKYNDLKTFVDLQTQLDPYRYTNKADEQEYFIRYLTDEEQQEILEVYEEMKNEYIKRLNAYYKRYSHKIVTNGYWANR